MYVELFWGLTSSEATKRYHFINLIWSSQSYCQRRIKILSQSIFEKITKMGGPCLNSDQQIVWDSVFGPAIAFVSNSYRFSQPNRCLNFYELRDGFYQNFINVHVFEGPELKKNQNSQKV